MMVSEASYPPPDKKFMKAAQAKGYGDDVDELLCVVDPEERCSGTTEGRENGVPLPTLQDEYVPIERIHPMIRRATRQDRKTHIIVKTLAVALAPGDCRVLSGKTREFQGPPSFPYIPGGDCCGVVVDVPDTETYFRRGDVVAARFTVAPRDAAAEFARVSATVCEKVTDVDKVSPVQAAALASASPAVCLADQYVRRGERILVLGAGGGVGSHFCQLARLRGASYVCGVSKTPERLLQSPLNCDDAIDYTVENVYESEKYQKEPFDTVYDLASGGWPKLVQCSRDKLPSIVKPANQGGRFVTFTSDTPNFEGHSLLPLLNLFLFKPLWRSAWTRIFTRRRLPSYTAAMGLPASRDVMTRTLQLANDGDLQAVVDGPYPFTTEGIRNAFNKLTSRHAKGKVVIKIADLPTEAVK